MAAFHVYHLTRRPLEAVLPALLAQARARGWRSLVKAPDAERARALDDALWIYSDVSFLPHGRDDEEGAAEQPVLLTAGDANPNGAALLLLVEGAAPPPDLAAFERVALLLDGRDPEAVAAARAVWRRVKATGIDLAYHQEEEGGGWTRRA